MASWTATYRIAAEKLGSNGWPVTSDVQNSWFSMAMMSSKPMPFASPGAHAPG
jgi:hypothetical protein